ncbi:putative nuclease HARBI1 [Mercenaria mercenaria]|uniref:putative nuclease HARBI1 n=1 Tax=Mercenaria mercenaria TaxID=6596 RepID=UPI00234E8B1E|nr:putative nuclease HARBI1 [Mercenaria mercenaria]
MAAVERRMRRIRRFQPIERVFRDRNNPLENLSMLEIFSRYRFMPESILVLTGMIFDVLDSPTMRSLPLPPLLSVLVTLHFYASGSHYMAIGDIHGISTSSVCRAVKRTTTAICQLLPTFVKFPADFASTQREFYNIAGFPKVVGCVDGTHVKVQAPTENEPDYVNRKGVHSINVQVM